MDKFDVSYLRNYATDKEPIWVEMVEIAPHQTVRVDFMQPSAPLVRKAKAASVDA